MAKSLRSKSKQTNRRVKRTNPKSDFYLRDKIRTQRLSDKLKTLTAVEYSDDDEEEVVEDVKDAAMAVDGTQGQPQAEASTSSSGKAEAKDNGEAAMPVDEKTVKTSGPRQSARLDWRKSRGMSASRKRTSQNSTTFAAKPRSFKSTGKAAKKGRRS